MVCRRISPRILSPPAPSPPTKPPPTNSGKILFSTRSITSRSFTPFRLPLRPILYLHYIYYLFSFSHQITSPARLDPSAWCSWLYVYPSLFKHVLLTNISPVSRSTVIAIVIERSLVRFWERRNSYDSFFSRVECMADSFLLRGGCGGAVVHWWLVGRALGRVWIFAHTWSIVG